MRNSTKFFLVLIVALSISTIFFYLKSKSPKSSGAIVVAERNPSDFPFLNITKVLDLKKHYIVDFAQLRELIIGEQKKHTPKSYVYFSYLNNGSWIGINERDGFYAASLVKVPLAMATMKAIEEKRLTLDTSYSLQEGDLDINFGGLYRSGVGTEKTLGEYLRIMLVESDNTARNAIYSIFKGIGIEDPLQDVYGSLGWDFLPEISPGDNITGIGSQNYNKISVKVLSNMFLALYNATYISPESSQIILDHLSKTDFNDKIRTGVPEGIDVSHKIGTAEPFKTYSDCGIVYAPNRHYILCVGASDTDEKSMAEMAKNISQIVYNYVINN